MVGFDLDEPLIGEVASGDDNFLVGFFFFLFMDFFGKFIAFDIKLVGQPIDTSGSPEPFTQFFGLVVRLFDNVKGIIPAFGTPSAEFITAKTKPLTNIFF